MYVLCIGSGGLAWEVKVAGAGSLGELVELYDLMGEADDAAT